MGRRPNQNASERRRRFEEIKQQTKHIDDWMSNQGFDRQRTDEHHWKYIGHGYGVSWWPSTGRLYFHDAKRHLTRYKETFAHSAHMLFAEVGHFLANPSRKALSEPEDREAAEFVEQLEPSEDDPLMIVETRKFMVETLELLALAIQDNLPVCYRLGDEDAVTDCKPGWKHMTILGNKRLRMFAICRTKEVPLEPSDITTLWHKDDVWIDVGKGPRKLINLGRDHVILDAGMDTVPVTFQELFELDPKDAYLDTPTAGRQPLRKRVDDWITVIREEPASKPDEEQRHG